MASLAPRPSLFKWLFEPLGGPALVAGGIIVWLAGAAYCHGYQFLLSGSDRPWSGSLIWSAVAVVPWFALFEWSKQPQGMEATRRPALLLGLVLGIAGVSIGLEYLVDFCVGDVTDRIGLLVMRRLPAIGATILLIALARKAAGGRRPSADAVRVEQLAPITEYVAAADNYVELHLGGRATLRRMTLTEAAALLEPLGFVRIHRCYLVNRAQVGSVHLGGRGVVRLKSGAELPIGRAYQSNARALA